MSSACREPRRASRANLLHIDGALEVQLEGLGCGVWNLGFRI